MPEQLIDYYDTNVANLESALADAHTALADAQGESDLVREAERSAATALATARRTEAAIRKALVAASMPAEVDALAEDLETALIAVRAAQGASLDVAERRKRATVALARAQSRLAEARVDLDQGRAEQIVATQAHERWEQWRADAAAPAVASVPADAADSVDPGANPHFAAARDRIEHDIPDDLRAFARDRGNAERQRVADERAAVQSAEDALVAELEDAGGAQGDADAAEVRFLRREEAFRQLVMDARERLERARRVFESIATSDPLPDAVMDRIEDPALADPATTAMTDRADAVLALEEAQGLAEAKQAELDARIEVVETAGDDPDTDAQVITLRDQLATLEEARDTADADLEALDDAIDRWEATVPDRTWRQLAAFDDAVNDLAELAGTDVALVRSEFDDAERALFLALTEADRHHRAARDLDDALFDERQRLAALVGQRDAQVLSAVRGDVP